MPFLPYEIRRKNTELEANKMINETKLMGFCKSCGHRVFMTMNQIDHVSPFPLVDCNQLDPEWFLSAKQIEIIIQHYQSKPRELLQLIEEKEEQKVTSIQ